MSMTWWDEPEFEFLNSASSADAFQKSIDEMCSEPVVAIDTETTGLNPLDSRVRLLQIGTDKKAWMFDCFDLGWDGNHSKLPAQIKELLESPKKLKVLQNAQFDWKMIAARLGAEMDGIYDTLIASKLLAYGDRTVKHGLSALTRRYLDLEMSKEEQSSNWSGPLTAEQLKYAARDVLVLPRIRNVQKQSLISSQLVDAAKIEFFCIPALSKMELNGIQVDKNLWEHSANLVDQRKAELEEMLRPYFPAAQASLFDAGPKSNLVMSQDAIKKALEKEMGITLPDAKNATVKSLKNRHPLAGAIVEYRQVEKLAQTYGRGYLEHVHPKTGRVHAEYNQISSGSGRMSCYSPNFQQIPKAFSYREAVVPGDGQKFIVADYSQIELRVAAVIANEDRMIEAYKKGMDLHRLTASKISGKKPDNITDEERQAAKAVNFGFLFGMGSRRFKDYASEEFSVNLTDDEATDYQTRYFEAYPNLKQWHRKAGRRAEESRMVQTIRGRKVQLSEGNSAFTAALNIPVQGTAADGMKLALGKLHRALIPTKANIVAVIHDELIVETPKNSSEEELSQIKSIVDKTMSDCMSDVLGNRIPIEVDSNFQKSWAM